MNKHGKKYQQAKAKLSPDKQIYSMLDGLKKVKECSYAKFNESVDAHINLGIDPTKGEQVVRGSVTLPHGTGKVVKVVVFAKGDAAASAQDAGADYVGAEDLIEKIEGGWTDFNYAVATPDMMGMVGKVAKILGPRGLVPNKKNGTVTFDVGPVVANLKKGQLFFKNDKNGIVHFSFGRVSFEPSKLAENFSSFLRTLAASRPSSSKGKFIRKITVSSTMGVGIQLNADELNQ